MLTDSRVIKYKIETGVVYPFNLVQVVESGKRVLDILCGDSGRESAQMEYARDTGSHRRGITRYYVNIWSFSTSGEKRRPWRGAS